MDIVRNILYGNALIDKGLLTYSGIGFKELMNSHVINIRNLLILNNSYPGENFHLQSMFNYVTHAEIPNLIESDSFEYGDFCWVDFDSKDMLDELTPIEIAEMLYFAHFGKPLKTSFFENIENNYAYWSHDDGWYGELYCRRTEDLKKIVIKTILLKIEYFTKSRIMPLSVETHYKLLNLTTKGVIIDFNKLIVESGNIRLPIYIVGVINDFDRMLNDLGYIFANALNKEVLYFDGKGWNLEEQ